MKIITRSEKEFSKVARAFAKKLRPNKKQATLVTLSGKLGTGKTFFVRACARALGIRAKIISPTFVIIKSHKLKAKSYKLFIHIDCYRLESSKELLKLGWREILSDSRNLIFLEWPERVLPAGRQVSKILSRRVRRVLIKHADPRHPRWRKLVL